MNSSLPTIPDTCAIPGTPLSDALEAGRIGFGLANGAGFGVGGGVVVAGCFFLCVVCVCALTLW